MEKKSEWMTSLSGANLVPKTHGRITFRGVIDTLEAEVIEAQVLAAGGSSGSKEPAGSVEADVCACLGEILEYLRAVIAAEVKESPLAPPFLFGMDAEEIHRRSHEAYISDAGGKPLLPVYTNGPLAARLNTLRAKVREAELLAVRVFGPASAEETPEGHSRRNDIILGMNRLSSALWWLYCDYLHRKK